ncbi:hypothetical protein ACFRI7_30580 [Streptomyces sp. NPDC056716]|uniref:hypothetical protein n=1 Tax=unclassified Streptomyces TaxID=2593676 RepID=UPI0036B4B7AD
MSIPPQPPQNPYGEQPPQNPYGQPPQEPYGQGPPPGAYPQPPAQAGPYGQPPQQSQQPQPPQQSQYPQAPQGAFGAPPPPGAPYGQPQPGSPYGAPQPWGAPPMAPPPRKKRTGLVLGIVGGAVAVVVAVVVGLALIGKEVEDSFPAAEYRLTVPETLLADEYQLAEDLSDTEGQAIEDEADGAWDAKDTTAVVATYNLGGDQNQGTLVVSGMYGRFQNTDEARDNMMTGAAEAEGMTVAVPPQDFTPDDSGVTVTCEVLSQSSMGTEMSIPTCGWVDGNTGASIAEVTPELIAMDPQDIDLEAAARSALQIREEMRQPIG